MGKTHPIRIANKEVGPPTTRCICAKCGMTQYSPNEGVWYVRIVGAHGLLWARRATPEPVCSICYERFEKVQDPRDDIKVDTPKMFSIPLLGKE